MTRPQLATEVGWEHLTQQQRLFSEEWVRTHNFPKSLEFAKYTCQNPVHPERFGRKLLKRVKRYVDYLEARAVRSTLVSIDAVRSRLATLGYSNLLDYYIIDEDTKEVRPKAITELTREEAAAVKAWTTVPFKKKRADGTEYDIWVLHDITLHDARGPLQDLLKSLGGMPTGRPGETPPPTGPQPGEIDFTKMPPAKVRELDSHYKAIRQMLAAAQDAQAIPPAGAQETGDHESGVSQSRPRLLPSTK